MTCYAKRERHRVALHKFFDDRTLNHRHKLPMKTGIYIYIYIYIYGSLLDKKIVS